MQRDVQILTGFAHKHVICASMKFNLVYSDNIRVVWFYNIDNAIITKAEIGSV